MQNEYIVFAERHLWPKWNHICSHTLRHINAYTRTRAYARTRTYICVCAYACVYVCVYVRVSINIDEYVWIDVAHTQAGARVFKWYNAKLSCGTFRTEKELLQKIYNISPFLTTLLIIQRDIITSNNVKKNKSDKKNWIQ